jgi:hypothetical protein
MPSRRQFVGSVGAGLLLAPFVNLAFRRRARAANQSKRLLIFSTMGTYPPLWTPTGISGQSITAWSNMTEPLSAVADNVVLVEGMPSMNPNDGHGSQDGLTGQTSNYTTDSTGKHIVTSSVDQYIAKMTAAGFGRPIATLLLGANTNANNGNTQYYGGATGGNLPTIGSPSSAYNTVFGTAMPSGTSAAALLARRQSILDTVTSEITGLQAQLGSSEKAKLDAHLDSIRALENKLTSTPTNGGGCMKPATPPADSALQFGTKGLDTLACNLLHQQIILAAFACDITRIACLEYGNDQYLLVNQSGLPADDEHSGYIHSEATTSDYPNLVKFEAYLATQFVNLVTALATTPDPLDSTKMLLDNTLVLWARDMGDAQNHNQQSMRFVLAGGNGGYLKTAKGGRYIKSTERHERILLNACEALGVTDYSGFGDPACPNKSPLPDIAA